MTSSGKGKKRNAARRVVLRAEFRSLPPLERALKLATEVPLNQTEISKVCGISRFTLHRAKKAQKEGRKPGKNGRSPLLSEEEIIEFGEVLEREAQGPYRLDYKRIKTLLTRYWITKRNGTVQHKVPKFSETYIRGILQKMGHSMKKERVVEPDRIIDATKMDESQIDALGEAEVEELK